MSAQLSEEMFSLTAVPTPHVNLQITVPKSQYPSMASEAYGLSRDGQAKKSLDELLWLYCGHW